MCGGMDERVGNGTYECEELSELQNKVYGEYCKGLKFIKNLQANQIVDRLRKYGQIQRTHCFHTKYVYEAHNTRLQHLGQSRYARSCL